MIKVSGILKNNYLKGYSYSFLGNLSNSLSQWIVFTFIAKKFGTESMGDYSLAIAWILPFYAFFSLQLRNMHVSDQGNEYGFDLFFSIRAICSLLFIATVVLVGVLFYRHIALVFFLVGLSRCFEMISDMIHAEFHKRKKIDVFSKRLITRSVFSIILTLLSFTLIHSFEIALISLPLAYFINLIIDFIYLKKEIGTFSISFEKKEVLKRLMVTGLITGFSLLFVYILPNIPRFMLEKYRNSFELGLFSGYMYLIVFARIFVQAVIQNSLPYLAEHYTKGNMSSFYRIIKKESLIMLGLGLAQFLIIPVSDYIFPLLYNKDFVGNKWLLAIVFTGSLFSFLAFTLNNVLNAMQLFKVQFPIYGTLVLISLLLGYVLIPKYGIEGGGLVFTLVAFSQCLLLFLCVKINLNKRLKTVENS